MSVGGQYDQGGWRLHGRGGMAAPEIATATVKCRVSGHEGGEGGWERPIVVRPVVASPGGCRARPGNKLWQAMASLGLPWCQAGMSA